MSSRTDSASDVTVVHLMRHGEVHNPEGVLYGRLPDFHLSELGKEMAERVADHLSGRDITHVVASPLERGVYLPPSAFESWFVSASHDARAIERIAEALPAAARAAAEASA